MNTNFVFHILAHYKEEQESINLIAKEPTACMLIVAGRFISF